MPRKKKSTANEGDPSKVENGSLAAAVGMPQFGFPQNQGSPYTEQIEDSTTLFKNLRWYLVSNFRQLLNQMYAELGLVQIICDVPVDDALRGGVLIKSKQLEEAQIEELVGSLDRDDDLNTAGQGAKWNRLFGGAGVIILTNQDPETPLDLKSLTIDDKLEFRAVDMWELTWDKQNSEGYDPTIQLDTFEFYSYYGKKLHKSRVMKLKGITPPSFIRPRLRGWGLSIVEPLVRALNQYLKATDLSFEVLDEFKVDIYKIKNLTGTLATADGEVRVAKRIQIANWNKNYQNAVVLDSEDDWDHRQLSFAGLAEASAGIRMQVASEMRMPLTKIFGISAAGFNSGEDDIEVYNSMVEGQVRNKIKYIILRMIEIKCQILFGFVPDDLQIKFQPLRVLTGEQEENVKNAKFSRLLQAYQAGLIDAKAFQDACNKQDLLGVTIDVTAGGFDDDTIEEDEDPYEETDTDDPGADRADTKKSRATEKGGASKGIVNSTAFDVASYEADGGDSWMDPARVAAFFENPGNVDESLWLRAKEASMKAFGKIKYAFVVWKYKKDGGKFK